MKIFPILFISLFTTIFSYSQDFQDEAKLMQSIYGLDKKEVVAEFIELSNGQKDAFWKLYDEYEVKRKEIGMKKIELIKKYISNYGEIKPSEAEALMNQSIPLRKSSEGLIDTYYKKIKNKTDPVVAVQFYQIENYLSALIRTKLLEEVFITKK